MADSPGGDTIAPASSENDYYTRPARASTDSAAIYVDADGDLRLRTKTKKEDCTQDLVVCSSTLARTSPVFKAMLSNRFIESRPKEGEWIVPLPDDDPEALLTLLYIIHSRFGLVSERPSLEELHQILCVAHKYDMTETVRPWARTWLKLAREPKRRHNPVMLTFVAWELGDQELFAEMVLYLLGECSINEKGHLTTPQGICLEDYDHFGPLDLLEKIRDARTVIIQSVLNMFHECSKTLLDGDHCSQRATSAKNSITCDYVIFGSLCRATFKIRGSLLPESADDVAETVNGFCDSARKVIDSIMCIPNHSFCSPAPKLREILDKALVPPQGSIITPDHKLYMRNQRQKSGLREPVAVQRRASERE